MLEAYTSSLASRLWIPKVNTYPMSSDCGAEDAAGVVPVLMYHSIAVDTSDKFRRFVVRPDEFAAHMNYLDAGGYHPVTAAELVATPDWRRLPERPVILTFDDAYADFYSAALPVLREHNFRATLYVPTAYVGATLSFLESVGEGNRMALTWDTLREVASEGIEIAAHSHTHPQMDRIPSAAVRDEVHRCRCLLEDKLGFEIAGFAYPFGYWNRAVRAAVAAEGFHYAFAVDELITTLSHDFFTLPRLSVNAGIGTPGLARLLETSSRLGSRRAATAKRIFWRAMRQIPVIGGDPREGWHDGP
jgi:peptidoglycan/xylan/chitin deacetylase (PgdA/CDA1 family)